MLMDALAWAALRHGVQIEAAHRVTSIRVDSDHVSIGTDDGTSWTAGTVVMPPAVGPGISMCTTARHRPCACTDSCCGCKVRGAPLHHIVWGPDCYVVPWQDSTVLVGAAVEDVGFDDERQRRARLVGRRL